MMPAILVAKATFVLTLGLTTAWLTRRNRAALRHAVLAATFAVLLVLPAASLLVPSVNIPVAVAAPAPAAVFTVAAPPASEPPIEPSPALAPPTRALPLSSILLTAWSSGLALFLLPVIMGLWQVRSLRRSGTPWLSGRSLLDSLAREAGLHRRVTLLLHRDLCGPMTCGAARPAIVLPADAPSWSTADLTRALLHELEHVKRMDWIGHCLARVVCALYWFNPLVWIAWRQLSLSAERACDDAVLNRSEGTDYAAQLVALAERLSSAAKSPLLAMASRADLSSRVNAALNPKQKRGPAGRLPVALASVAAALVLLTLSPLTVAAAAPSDPPAVPAPPVPAADLTLPKPHRVPQSLKMVAVAQPEPQAPSMPMPRFRSVTQLVVLQVKVTDAAGNPMEGLSAADFLITENGAGEPITSFEAVPHEYYVLGYYSPNAATDGAFRAVNVTLKGNPAARLDFRSGYYAAKSFADAAPATNIVPLAAPPVLTYKKEPEYSPEARKAKYQGTVILQVNVDTSGNPTDVRVLRSLGLGLDEKAIEAVKQWKFKPAMQNGNPIAMPVEVEVDFRLL